MERLKRKWGITSNVQLVVILIVFSLAGSLTVFVRKPVFALFNLESSAIWLKTIAYLLVVPPVHFVLLLIIGSLTGQFQFFWNFEKRILSRFKRKS